MASSSNAQSHQKSSLDGVRKLRKRQQPPVYNGVGTTFEDKNSDFLCPICFEMISEAHMTKCGHTFCYDCIVKSLEHSTRCPKCNFTIEKKEQIFPNFLLNELITKYQRKLVEQKFDSMKFKGASELRDFFSQETDSLNIEDVNYMLEILSQKKQQIEADCYETQIRLLKEFLLKVKSRKQEEIKKLNEEIGLIDQDSQLVEDMMEQHTAAQVENSLFDRTGSNWTRSESSASKNNLQDGFNGSNWTRSEPSTSKSNLQDGFNGSKYGKRIPSYMSALTNRRKRIHAHFDDLEKTYFCTRKKNGPFSTSEDARHRLNEFMESLSKFTRFSSIRSLATLNYANDHYGSNIVSSIEFDKDNEFFAIAGVTKKIKMFEYGTVISDSVDVHYPVNEMLCNSKISCISWSSYHKGMLASSDYEGMVTLWDAFTGQKVKIFQEHEKRCWSVDFNRVDTKLIASGSDDSKVKLWSTAMEHSITCLEAKANVCCVKFNPESRYHLTFGSADHCVHYYDLRNTKQALEVFKGHKKAVSYVKFLNTNIVVSASTDSQLKLWNVNHQHCLRSFRGHLNEKNFVGLATDGDFISCGSENNSLYIYYKGLSSHILTFKFEASRSILEKEKNGDDTNEFVSAVCWRTGSNVLVAANSQGTIKVLELI